MKVTEFCEKHGKVWDPDEYEVTVRCYHCDSELEVRVSGSGYINVEGLSYKATEYGWAKAERIVYGTASAYLYNGDPNWEDIDIDDSEEVESYGSEFEVEDRDYEVMACPHCESEIGDQDDLVVMVKFSDETLVYPHGDSAHHEDREQQDETPALDEVGKLLKEAQELGAT